VAWWERDLSWAYQDWAGQQGVTNIPVAASCEIFSTTRGNSLIGGFQKLRSCPHGWERVSTASVPGQRCRELTRAQIDDVWSAKRSIHGLNCWGRLCKGVGLILQSSRVLSRDNRSAKRLNSDGR
jgi:hypothetical protein